MLTLLFLLSHSNLLSIARNKAVADGAVSFCIDHFVTERISKFSVGIACNLIYDPNNPEHAARSADKYVNAAGEVRLSGFFDVILPKVDLSVVMTEFTLNNSPSQNITVLETKEFRHSFTRCTFDREEFKSIRESIICYRGLQAYKENSYPIMDREPSKQAHVYFVLLAALSYSSSRREIHDSLYRPGRYIPCQDTLWH